MRLRAQSLTTLLVGVIALSYLIQLLLPGYEEALWISGAEFDQGKYWRLFTVALVHGGFFHLGFNLMPYIFSAHQLNNSSAAPATSQS